MSRRKDANRAEAIVKGIGSIILLLLLVIMTQALPAILKGKNTHEMINTTLTLIAGFAFLTILVGVIALVVWFRVLKGKGKRDRSTRFK
jgi:hypothetical protein